jgi:hypothetical protein
MKPKLIVRDLPAPPQPRMSSIRVWRNALERDHDSVMNSGGALLHYLRVQGLRIVLRNGWK